MASGVTIRGNHDRGCRDSISWYADQRQSVSRRGGVGRPTCSSESGCDQGAIGCCAGPRSSVRTQPPRAFHPIARRPSGPQSRQRRLPVLRRSRQWIRTFATLAPPCAICCPRLRNTAAPLHSVARGVPRDWKSAVARAESNGRPDWANGLRDPVPSKTCRIRRNLSARSSISW